MPGPTSTNLYDVLSANGAKLGTYSQFTKNLYDVGTRKAFYSQLIKEKFPVGSWANFNSRMGYDPASPYYISPDNIKYDDSTGMNIPPPAKGADEAIGQDVGGLEHFLENTWNHFYMGVAQMSKVFPLAEAYIPGVHNIFKPTVSQSDIDALTQLSKTTGEPLSNYVHKPTYNEITEIGLKRAQEAEENVNKAFESDNAAQLDKYYSWKHGGVGQKIGAALGGIMDMVAPLVLSAPTFGASFGLTGLSEGTEEASKKGLNPIQSLAFGTLYGVITGAMNEVPILGKFGGKLSGKALDRFAERKASSLLIDWVDEHTGQRITGTVMSKLMADAKTSVGDKFAEAGIRSLYAAPEALAAGATMVGATQGLKELANKLSGKQVFDKSDFESSEYWKGMGQVLLMSTLFHGANGLMASTTGRYIKEQIARGVSADKISQQLDGSEAFSKLNPTAQKDIKDGLTDLDEMNKKIPADVPTYKRLKLLEYAFEKRQTEKQYQNLLDRSKIADGASKIKLEQSAQRLKNALGIYDDLSDELLYDKKYDYKKTDNEDGTTRYTKQMEGHIPVDISPDHYDFAIERRRKSDALIESNKRKSKGINLDDQKSENPFEGDMLFTNETPEATPKGEPSSQETPEEKDDFLKQLNDMQYDKYIQDLNDEIKRLTELEEQYTKEGKTRSANRIKVEGELVDRAKDFSVKYKRNIEDVIEKMRDMGELAVDCKGRNANIKQGGNI